MFKHFAILILVCLVIVSCTDQQGGEMLEDMNRTNVPINIRIVTHDSYEEVTDAYREFVERQGQVFDGNTREGWAGWSTHEPYLCVIHVVKPKYVEDRELTTWGHELAHCVYGKFHSDQYRK